MHSIFCRDVFLSGSCDDGVMELAKELGWEVMNSLSHSHVHFYVQIERIDGFIY